MGRLASGTTVILVVEDEPLLLEAVADELEEAGFSTIRAADGTSALDVLKSPSEVGVLFTDIRLPGVDGWQLAEEARVLRPDIPVIYATGYTHSPPRQVVGAVLFNKPYRPSSIIRVIRELIIARPPGAPGRAGSYPR